MLCNKTVKITFCGHRDVIEYNAVYKELLSTLEQFFIFSEYNGTLLEFYCGGYGTFDSMCSKAISELKEKYPKSNIKKLLITPYIIIKCRICKYYGVMLFRHLAINKRNPPA